jgi:hypothetical protein
MRFPWLELVWTDGHYNARQVDHAVIKVPLRIEIKQSDDSRAWLGRWKGWYFPTPRQDTRDTPLLGVPTR